MTTTLAVTTDADIAADIAPGTGYVAIEFNAAWCAPCRVFGPIVEEAARGYGDRLRVLQMDADANQATSIKLGVRNLPSLVVFRDGVEVDRIVGAMPLARLRERLDAALTR